MDQKEIEREKMEAMQALASTNMKVSEARNTLIQVQEEETVYLVGREKRAMERIDEVLKDSESVLEKVSTNFKESVDLSREVTDTMAQIMAFLTAFRESKERFAEKCDAWDAMIGIKEDTIADLKRKADAQTLINSNEHEALQKERKRINEEKRKLDDDKAELERNIKRYKEGKL